MVLFSTKIVFRVLSLALLQSQICYRGVAATAATATTFTDDNASTDAVHTTSPSSSSSSSPCAYSFVVCSKPGGAEGVDFRSHFSIYAAQYKLSGWVRNGCDSCVYGMFAGGMVQNSNTGTSLYCNNAHDFVLLLQNSTRMVTEFDSKAGNLVATVEEITGYPNNPQMMCPSNGNKILPKGYVKSTQAVIDWSFTNSTCRTPCDCLPTDPVTDCQITEPGTHNDCLRFPLGSDKKQFPDCNSLYVHNNQNCFEILDGGSIGSSGHCGNGKDYDWVNETKAAKCCGPWDSANEYGRTGLSNPPSNKCAAYTIDCKCPGGKHCPPPAKSEENEL